MFESDELKISESELTDVFRLCSGRMRRREEEKKRRNKRRRRKKKRKRRGEGRRGRGATARVEEDCTFLLERSDFLDMFFIFL